MKRPNVLFLMSDEHRSDVTGFEGNSIIRTPLLDSLAATGISFRNAYTPSPICVPGRQSMMAGQLPRTTGCERFGEDLAPGYMTFARRLAQYGYQTVACGKLHHSGPDQMQGWTHRIGNDVSISAKYIDGLIHEEADRYRIPSQKWSDSKEVLRAGIGSGPVAQKDQYTVQGAIQFIHEYFTSPWYDREGSAPLLLKVSLVQPHYPYFTSEDKFTYYLNRVQPYLNEEVFDHPFLGRRQVSLGKDVSERELRRATAAYYGMVETIDDHFRKVIDTLEHVGQNLDEWIIIYTSDHGEMLGQHGVWEKQKFFEASARVPLIIRFPERFRNTRTVHANVNLCDLFSTLCELTGIPAPDGLDSRSLVPLMEGNDSGWNNETISQFGAENLMIKKDDLKYQYYGEQMPEVLFDLQRNPEETINYIDNPQYTEELRLFRKRRGELGFGPVSKEVLS